MEYKHVEEAAFRLTSEERHHLVEKLLLEYQGIEYINGAQWCEMCNMKQISGLVLFYRCALFDTCGRRFCMACSSKNLIAYGMFYM